METLASPSSVGIPVAVINPTQNMVPMYGSYPDSRGGTRDSVRRRSQGIVQVNESDMTLAFCSCGQFQRPIPVEQVFNVDGHLFKLDSAYVMKIGHFQFYAFLKGSDWFLPIALLYKVLEQEAQTVFERTLHREGNSLQVLNMSRNETELLKHKCLFNEAYDTIDLMRLTDVQHICRSIAKKFGVGSVVHMIASGIVSQKVLNGHCQCANCGLAIGREGRVFDLFREIPVSASDETADNSHICVDSEAVVPGMLIVGKSKLAAFERKHDHFVSVDDVLRERVVGKFDLRRHLEALDTSFVHTPKEVLELCIDSKEEWVRVEDLKHVLDQTAQYVKQYRRNRCRQLIQEGVFKFLSIDLSYQCDSIVKDMKKKKKVKDRKVGSADGTVCKKRKKSNSLKNNVTPNERHTHTSSLSSVCDNNELETDLAVMNLERVTETAFEWTPTGFIDGMVMNTHEIHVGDQDGGMSQKMGKTAWRDCLTGAEVCRKPVGDELSQERSNTIRDGTLSQSSKNNDCEYKMATASIFNGTLDQKDLSEMEIVSQTSLHDASIEDEESILIKASIEATKADRNKRKEDSANTSSSWYGQKDKPFLERDNDTSCERRNLGSEHKPLFGPVSSTPIQAFTESAYEDETLNCSSVLATQTAEQNLAGVGNINEVQNSSRGQNLRQAANQNATTVEDLHADNNVNHEQLKMEANIRRYVRFSAYHDHSGAVKFKVDGFLPGAELVFPGKMIFLYF